MPYAWTHIVYGDELAKKINYSPTHKLLYHFGCQGPDFYFFYRFWPWRKSKHGTILGDVFHTKECGPVLLELIKKAKASSVLQDYIAGFITHHILDRTTHAFIHYYAGYKKYKHQHLESILDTLIAKKLRGVKTWETALVPQIDVGKKLPEEVVDTLYETAMVFYPEESHAFPKKEYHQAYEDMKTFFTFTFDPSGLKNALTFGLLSPFRYTPNMPKRDYFNEGHKTWLHPAISEEEHTESFWDLWKVAINDGTRILQKVRDYWSNGGAFDTLPHLIGNISYDNGKDCDLRLVNQFSDPIV